MNTDASHTHDAPPHGRMRMAVPRAPYLSDVGVHARSTGADD
jgi:hypothetical protein